MEQIPTEFVLDEFIPRNERVRVKPLQCEWCWREKQ